MQSSICGYQLYCSPIFPPSELAKAKYEGLIEKFLQQAEHSGSAQFLGRLDCVPPFLWALVNKESYELWVVSEGLYWENHLLQHTKLNEQARKDLLELKDRFVSARLEDKSSLWPRQTWLNGLSDLQSDAEKTIDLAAVALMSDWKKKLDHYKAPRTEKIRQKFFAILIRHPLAQHELLKLAAALGQLGQDRKGKISKALLLERFESLRPFVSSSTLKRALTFCLQLIGILPAFLVGLIARSFARLAAKQFLCSPEPRHLQKELFKLKNSGRSFSLDRLGELVLSREESQDYCNEVLKLIRQFRSNELTEKLKPDREISLKVSALSTHFDPLAFDRTYDQISPYLEKIFQTALECRVAITIDAEHFALRDLIVECVCRFALDPKWEQLKLGFVLQAYLRDAYFHGEKILKFAQQSQRIVSIRLVKGAYWDEETIQARAHGHSSPQFLEKAATDLQFRQLVRWALENSPPLHLLVGSHNLFEHAYAICTKETFPESLPLEHQFLHQTFEAASLLLASEGRPTRNYVPVGDLVSGMGYLVRRILENSSQLGLLAKTHLNTGAAQEESTTGLIKQLCPAFAIDPSFNIKESFENFPEARPYLWNQRQAFFKRQTSALLEKYQLGELPDVEGSLKPTDFLEILEWRSLDVSKETIKNNDLNKALTFFAFELALWRDELVELLTREAKKNPAEGYAEVDEAIDFLLYYQHGNYQQNGGGKQIAAVICPWNFPLAIPVGMATGALLSGHRVVLKSAEQTPLIAELWCRMLKSCGLSREWIFHGIGGATLGKEIIEQQPDALFFTGSLEVGRTLFETMAQQRPNQTPLIITEMGGKNAAIVLPDAELDLTVSSLLSSCFSYAGQKCSACSRIFVAREILWSFANRFVAAAESLQVASAQTPGAQITPLISESEKQRILKLNPLLEKEILTSGGRILLNQIDNPEEGLVGPWIGLLPFHAATKKESYSQIEIFAPIVHIIPYLELDEVVSCVNAGQYALTAGLYSQSDKQIKRLLSQLRIGNIYINRSQTGARVAIEPFGGFKSSGTGPKAGGSHYLPLCLQKSGGELKGARVSLETSFDISAQIPTKSIPGQKNYLDFSLRRPGIHWTRAVKDCHPDFQILFDQAEAHGIPQTFADSKVHSNETTTIGPRKQLGFSLNPDAALTEELIREALFLTRTICENTIRYGSPIDQHKDLK